MKRSFYFLIIMILFVLPSFAAEWKEIDDKTYIDINSIKWFKYPTSAKKENISRHGIEFITKKMNDNSKDFTDKEKIYNKKVSYLESKQIIDCKNQTIALKNYTAYDTKNIAITSHNILFDKLKENKATSDPKSEFLLNFVCNYDIPEPDVKNEPEKETIKEPVKIENIANRQTNKKNENNIRDGVDYRSYMRELEYSLRKNWNPPKDTKPYRVVLYFTVLKNGQVKNIKVQKSSGNLVADEVAIKTLKDTAPLKPLPDKYKGKSVDIRFTFDYFPMGYKSK